MVHIWESRGYVHTVYSQMNERVTGEVIKKEKKKSRKKKNQKKNQKIKGDPKVFGATSRFFSFWSFDFSPFPAILPIPI